MLKKLAAVLLILFVAAAPAVQTAGSDAAAQRKKPTVSLIFVAADISTADAAIGHFQTQRLRKGMKVQVQALGDKNQWVTVAKPRGRNGDFTLPQLPMGVHTYRAIVLDKKKRAVAQSRAALNVYGPVSGTTLRSNSDVSDGFGSNSQAEIGNNIYPAQTATHGGQTPFASANTSCKSFTIGGGLEYGPGGFTIVGYVNGVTVASVTAPSEDVWVTLNVSAPLRSNVVIKLVKDNNANGNPVYMNATAYCLTPTGHF